MLDFSKLVLNALCSRDVINELYKGFLNESSGCKNNNAGSCIKYSFSGDLTDEEKQEYVEKRIAFWNIIKDYSTEFPMKVEFSINGEDSVYVCTSKDDEFVKVDDVCSFDDDAIKTETEDEVLDADESKEEPTVEVEDAEVEDAGEEDCVEDTSETSDDQDAATLASELKKKYYEINKNKNSDLYSFAEYENRFYYRDLLMDFFEAVKSDDYAFIVEDGEAVGITMDADDFIGGFNPFKRDAEYLLGKGKYKLDKFVDSVILEYGFTQVFIEEERLNWGKTITFSFMF